MLPDRGTIMLRDECCNRRTCYSPPAETILMQQTRQKFPLVFDILQQKRTVHVDYAKIIFCAIDVENIASNRKVFITVYGEDK